MAATVRQGSFKAGPAYPYVVDSDGNVNASGFAVEKTDGGAGEGADVPAGAEKVDGAPADGGDAPSAKDGGGAAADGQAPDRQTDGASGDAASGGSGGSGCTLAGASLAGSLWPLALLAALGCRRRRPR